MQYSPAFQRGYRVTAPRKFGLKRGNVITYWRYLFNLLAQSRIGRLILINRYSGYNVAVIRRFLKGAGRVISSFLIHWYRGGFMVFSTLLGNIFRAVDGKLLIRESFRNLFSIDKSVGALPNIKMFFIRAGKTAISAFIYILLPFLFIIAYLIWAAIPPFLVYRSIYSK